MLAEHPSSDTVEASVRRERLHLSLLGRFRLARGEREIRLAGGKAMLLLAFLGCARDRTARRDRLASLLWQDSNVEQARASLRQTLSRLRAALDGERDALWSDNERIALTPDDWAIDVEALEACDGLDADDVDPAWASTFLSGVHRRDPSIDAWLEGERQRHRRTAGRVFSAAIERALRDGDATRALELGTRLIALDPFAESAHRSVMLAYELCGERGHALRQYRTLVRILDEGLGVAPDADSRALYERLRQPAARGALASLPNAKAPPRARATSGGQRAPEVVVAPSQRLVAVLAIRRDELAERGTPRDGIDALVRRHGGEPILSHGAESLFVFGLAGDAPGGAEAAFRAALQVRESGPAGEVLACGCASGLVRIDADAYPVGTVVQRAARLALLADDGNCVIDRAVHVQVPLRVEVEEIRLRDQLCYRVLNASRRPPVVHHRLFGRRAELAQLKRMLLDTADRGAALAIVSGEAGMGKTHLTLSLELAAREFGSAVVRLGFSTHAVSPSSLTERLARRLFDELVQSGAPTDFDDVEQATLEALLHARAERGERTVREDEARHRRELVGTMIDRLTSSEPLLLIVEDCHWAERVDIELLIELIDARAGRPILILATERHENESFATAVRSRVVDLEVISLTLTPLRRRDAAALVRSLVDDADRERRILERAGGHPLFLVQLAEAGIEPDAPVPVSIVALVQGELDRLCTRARDACLKAAILGPELGLSTLETLFPEIDRGDLGQNRLLQRQGERLSFRHALIHEAVYALIGPAERERLHDLAARHFKSINAAEHAHHALRCGDALTGARACADAAEWLLAENRHAEAERLVARGLDLEPTGDVRARLLLAKARLSCDGGDLNDAVATCRRALDLASDAALRVRMLVCLATLLKRRSEFDRAAVQLREASRIAEGHALSSHHLAELEHEWGNIMFMRGRAGECRRHHERARAHAERTDDRRLQAVALGGLGDAYYTEGKARSAHRCFESCVRLAESGGLTSIAIAHRPMVAFTGFMLNPGSDAVSALRHAIAEARRWKSAYHELLAHAMLAEVLLIALRLEEAEAQMHRTAELQRRCGGDRFAPDMHYVEALWHLANGAAEAALASALDGVRRYGNDAYLGPSFQAVLAVSCEDEAMADRALAAGEALIRRGSMLHNRLNVALHGCASYWRRGDRERARALLERARRRFGVEPLGVLDAALDWLREPVSAEAASARAAREALERRAVSLLAVTCPRPELSVELDHGVAAPAALP